jgi:hypothetical protein
VIPLFSITSVLACFSLKAQYEWHPVVAAGCHCSCLHVQGLHNMIARLTPLAQQRELLEQVSDLQANKLGNEVRLVSPMTTMAQFHVEEVARLT